MGDQDLLMTSSLSPNDSPVPPESVPACITPPLQPSVDDSKYLAVTTPYPPKANLDNFEDQRALALWLASCAGKEVLRALFYRPSSPESVVIEVNRDFGRFHDLLGQHVWSEFLSKPTKEHRDKSSTVFYSTFNAGRLLRSGWTRVKIEENWFLGWSANDPRNFIKYPYPKSTHCSSSSGSEGKPGEPVCRLLPGLQQFFAATTRQSNASPPSSTTEAAAPSDTVSVPSATSEGIKSFSPPLTQSPAPSYDSRPPSDSVFLRPSSGASRAQSFIGGSITRSSNGGPPSCPGVGRRLSSSSQTPTSERIDWTVNVENIQLKSMNDPLIPTPPSSHSPEQRQFDDQLGSIEPPRIYDYDDDDDDKPRHSTEAAMIDLFDDGFFTQAPTAPSGGGEITGIDPDDPMYDPWNPPADTAENLWEGYDEPRLELPTKLKKGGDWTCPQHGSLCSPGICKERAHFEHGERMRNAGEKREMDRVERMTSRKSRRRNRTTAGSTGEWRSSPPYLGENSSSTTAASTATTTTTSSTDNGSDSDTSHNPAPLLPLDHDNSSLSEFRLNDRSADTQSTVSPASRTLGTAATSEADDDGEIDEGASAPTSRTATMSSVISRNSRPATQRPTSDARSSADQSPSRSRHSVSAAPPVSAASSNNNTGRRQRSGTTSATQKSASEARTRSVASSRARTPSLSSSKASGEYISKWLAEIKPEPARQKISKGARKRRNKTETARAQVMAQEQEALATVLEEKVEVEPHVEGEWGNPNVVW